MLTDIPRFYREAPADVAVLDEVHTTLADYLDMRRYRLALVPGYQSFSAIERECAERN